MPIVLAARLWKVDRRATWSGTSTPMAIAVPETPMSMEFSATAPQSSHPDSLKTRLWSGHPRFA